MFVDDDTRILSGIRRGLRALHDRWDMDFIADPEAALAAFQACPADVVVTDMMMPQMSGLDLVLAMRKIAPDSVYIMLTGSSDLQTAVDAVNVAEIFRYYTKPCDTDLLRSGVEAGLDFGGSQAASQSPSQKTKNIAESVGLAALDQLSLGVIVVDATARVIFSNKSGGRILAERDGFQLSGNEICRTDRVKETKELHLLIQSAVECDPTQPFDVGVMAVTRPSMKRSLSVLVTPFSASDHDKNTETGLTFLFVSDPETHPVPEPEALGKLFGLSMGEAKIAHALAQGEALNDAAVIAGVTVSTARTYLKQIFGKTDTNRQSDLVKLVLTSPRLSGLSSDSPP